MIRFVIATTLLLAGCAPPQLQPGDVRMADPRTGVVAVCLAGRPSIDPARSDLANCIAELRHYGFAIEQELLAAHEAPRGTPAPPTAGASPDAASPAAYPQAAERPSGLAAQPRFTAAPLGDRGDLAPSRPWYSPDIDSTPARR